MSLILCLTNEDEQSGGMRAVYYLLSLLVRAGYDVCLNANPGPDDVVVYTDNMPGNLYGGRRVVRYMCYFAGAYFGGKRLPSHTCVIVYHEDYLEEIGRHCDVPPTSEQVVLVPSIEPGLFYPEDKIQESILYVGKRNIDVPLQDWDGVPIVGKDNFKRADFATLLRRTRNLYSLDHHTVVTSEAALAGCQPWHVVGPGRAAVKADLPDHSIYLMRPEADVALAHRFVKIIREFFDDQSIAAKVQL